MSIHYKDGNLLEADMDYICHQVNCQGHMSSGIAKKICEWWPVVYERYTAGYRKREEEVARGYYGSRLSTSETLLGYLQKVQVTETKTVINMFAQQYHGYDGKRYTSYEAFWNCLCGIQNSVPKGSKIGFPSKIGCGLGGANWEVIRTMIEQVLGKDFEVYIYSWEE